MIPKSLVLRGYAMHIQNHMPAKAINKHQTLNQEVYLAQAQGIVNTAVEWL